jgi:hypothetical protein
MSTSPKIIVADDDRCSPAPFLDSQGKGYERSAPVPNGEELIEAASPPIQYGSLLAHDIMLPKVDAAPPAGWKRVIKGMAVQGPPGPDESALQATRGGTGSGPCGLGCRRNFIFQARSGSGAAGAGCESPNLRVGPRANPSARPEAPLRTELVEILQEDDRPSPQGGQNLPDLVRRVARGLRHSTVIHQFLARPNERRSAPGSPPIENPMLRNMRIERASIRNRAGVQDGRR